jgi:hypothetical protein
MPATTPPGARSRTAFALAAIVVAFVVGFLVAPRGPGGMPLATYHDQDLWALVPAGWKDEGLVAPYGTAKAGWFDLSNPQDSETVQATLPAGPTPQARASARAAQLRGLKGYAQSYLGPLSHLPGGRTAWLLQYELSGTYTAVFEFDACTPAIAMTVTVDSSSHTTLYKLDDDLAEGAEPVCDGPAFSATDRADIALPLTLPS